MEFRKQLRDNRKLSVITLGLLLLSLFTIINIKPIQAISPNFIYDASNLSISGTGITWNTLFAPTTQCSGGDCTGLTFIITMESFPAKTISTITDNIGGTTGTNDTWHQISSLSNTVVGETIWYTVVNKVLTSTYFKPTISFTTSCVNCNLEFFYSTTPLSLSSSGAVPMNTRLSGGSAGVIPKLNVNVLSNKFTFVGSQQYVVLNAIDVNDSSASVYVNYGVTSPLVTLRSQAPQGIGSWDIASTNITPAGSTISQQFSVVPQTSSVNDVHFGCSLIYQCTVYNGAMVTAVFSTTTITPPSCTNCGIGIFSTKDTTTTFNIMIANETLLKLSDAPLGGALIQNVTTEIQSYTNASPSKSHDIIWICIYELPSGTLSSNTPISSGNPMSINICQKVTTITNGQTNQYIHWYPNVLIPPSTTFGISILSIFSGLLIYQDTTTIQTLYGDTADFPTGYAVPPNSISNFFITSENIFFGMTGSQTSIITTGILTTTICASSATCIISTVTSQSIATVTTTILNLQGADNGAQTLNVITYLPVWIFPLIFGAIGAAVGIGAQGLIFGFAIGAFMGYQLGLFPIWMMFIILVILYMMIRR